MLRKNIYKSANELLGAIYFLTPKDCVIYKHIPTGLRLRGAMAVSRVVAN